ncbi:F0F1 ATP synthase subunit alpha [Oribacterium sp. oral taxon 102]|uniref:F0F1 ATP synthase subunit alpha n=1 Tax=Oribacterium sp. oral taxon 102 TaxID=671214 RepID=UPI0015BCDD01|nr:F0F1 ATP synthase subunit alpha [Oribacterium sp. oral taxon 102]NWO20440.1 F0F1 ATP synthase subunit alpha [Oribacterium sp. oral taxon 102]
MIQKTVEYAAQLNRMKVPKSVIEETTRIFEVLPETSSQLADPTVPLEQRHSVINSVFPTEVRDILKVLCDDNTIGTWREIADEYMRLASAEATVLRVKLRYVTKPSEEQLIKIQKFVSDKYRSNHVQFDLEEDASLGGGFILEVGNDQFDWSTRGRREQFMEEIRNTRSSLTSDADIITILRNSVNTFDLKAEKKEIGFVESIGDGVVILNGLDHAMYGEVIQFDNGVKGMVQNIERDRIGVILFGDEADIIEGSRGIRTGRMAGIPVGDAYLGRVIDALGAPIDGRGSIPADDYRAIEQPAPGIIDRKSVSEPMQTGILAIDSMFPIGRGQRELIIGDRQTGKTSIAIDTILNQHDKDCVCIYVGIGQKESTLAALVDNLKKHGAMDYTCVVAATAADPAPIQYIAPYAATSLAEYFMYKGKDVLIVYDDLSKHAVAYRALSLLLGRAPGREAYPGDVFYLHSRLLERSCRLSDALGGGSITALPIIETQAGDVSAYIPTNVISITDGQIFLESSLFFEGQRPAVNVGLSVSRVGGAAQAKAMKKASGSLRIDLAQYREMAVFTQFSSDLDENTKAQLTQGRVLMELLKQPLGRPMSLGEQVVTLVVALDKLMMDVPPKEVKRYQGELLSYFHEKYPEIEKNIEISRLLTDDSREKIRAVAEEFRATYQKEAGVANN